jgi:hypothetical protein
LLLARFPDLPLEASAAVDLLPADFPLDAGVDLLAPDLPEAGWCLEGFAAPDLAVEVLLDEVFEDVELAAE